MTRGLSESPSTLRSRQLFPAAIACLAFVLVQVASVRAADWSLEAGLSQKFDYDTNIDLQPDSAGYALGSISTLKANLIALAPTSRFDLKSDIAYQAYTGPGATDELDAFLPFIETKYGTQTRDTDFDISASYSVQSLTAADIDDTGFIQEAGVNQHTITVQSGVAYKIDQLNKIDFRTIASKVDFSPASGDVVPYNDLDNTLTLSRRLSPTMDGNLRLGIEFYDAEDDFNTLNTIYSAEANISSRLTRRFTLRLGGGVNAIQSEQDLVANTDHNFSIGPLVNFGFDYRLKRTTISLDASEEFSPTDFGGVDEIQQVTLVADHRFNEVSSFNISLLYSHQTPATDQITTDDDEPTTALSIAPIFQYQLAREWQMQLGYRYLTEKLDEGSAVSHDFNFTVSRNFTVFP